MIRGEAGTIGGDGLGDLIGRALARVGITDEGVSRWLGAPCGCAERRERLNALGFWARRVLRGNTAGAAGHLDAIVGAPTL